MSKKKKQRVLRFPALEVSQGKNRKIYSFAVDGKEIPEFATISRVSRGGEGELLGYQRPEVRSHIGQIRSYIESENPIIPNAIVIAFDDTVKFESTAKVNLEYGRPGFLIVPVTDDSPEQDKPGWIVDGQQRCAAIREAKVDNFCICVTAFIAEHIEQQREQFILVNATKPLPRGLVYELLPDTNAKLPSLLQRKRFPATLLDRLNRDADSPFAGAIKTPTNPEGRIKDNSVLKMLENSLSDGVLYRYRIVGDEGGDIEEMLVVLKNFWTAVAAVFSDPWELPPRRSRLTHGAGIVSLGFVMDAIADRHRDTKAAVEEFEQDLKVLSPVCRWTDGFWDFGPGVVRKWNEIQNTSKDIQLLSNYLLLRYRELVWSNASSAG